MFYHSGSIYDGNWHEDHRSGAGREAYSNADLYKGEFKNGKPHGKGLFKWSNGEVYGGEWSVGYKEGYGKWENSQGDYYDGEWKAGKAHGKGKQKWNNGCNQHIFLCHNLLFY